MSSNNTRVPQLLAVNKEFAKGYSNPSKMVQLRPLMKDPVLVLTCMDPRVIPEQFFGPENPRIAVFRNAGGRATRDVARTAATVRSLSFYNGTLAVMVVHHTDCGMTHITDDQIREDLRKNGADDDAVKEGFGCFTTEDLEQTILEDVETLKKHEWLRGAEIKGYLLETETGVLREL